MLLSKESYTNLLCLAPLQNICGVGHFAYDMKIYLERSVNHEEDGIIYIS